MRVALLVCDHVAESLQKKHGDYVYMFGRLLKNVKMDPFFVVDNQFPEVADFDGFIVSGSKKSVYDQEEWIGNLMELTRQAFHLKKKYVGVCFGHQVIAESLGGKVERATNGYQIGIHEFQISHHQEWMMPKINHFKVLMLCQDQVEKLPSGASVLASSPSCPVGMFQIDKHFLAIQGHPEFTKAYNQDVFESRVDRIGKEKVVKAKESLASNPDAELLSGFIEQFLYH